MQRGAVLESSRDTSLYVIPMVPDVGSMSARNEATLDGPCPETFRGKLARPTLAMAWRRMIVAMTTECPGRVNA